MLDKQDLQNVIRNERRAVLMVNTASRKGRRLFADAADALAARDIILTAALRVQDPSRFPGLIREALAARSRFIIVGGGDGTISSIVDGLAYKEAVLGLLPLGTANSFARSLGIPLDLESACDVVAGGKVADIELGKLNGDYFANMASIGLSADIARSTPRWLKRIMGHFAYVVTAIPNFFLAQKFVCDLVLDKGRETVRTHLVIVANGSYFGVADLSPEARIEDRKLFVLTMDMVNRWQLLLFWYMFMRKKHRQVPQVKGFFTRQVTIETHPVQCIDIDGEACPNRTPATLSLAPEALKIIVPQGFRERTFT